TLTQIEGVVAEGQPEGALSAGGIEIRGQACAFDDVNDFLLVLQRSPLLEGETVQLVDARLQDEVLDPSEDGGCPGAPSNDPFNLVDYTVRSDITSKSASELLGTLESEGAVGLVSRLRVLEDTGVIQP
ncbi:MAG: PilN domain-containing protein, partial [Pseudanabaenales cyanobacterium]|nr:PilN domain-containing protein [Pseudanabaenales cyanobacterium]